jgi:hypothetical protein
MRDCQGRANLVSGMSSELGACSCTFVVRRRQSDSLRRDTLELAVSHSLAPPRSPSNDRPARGVEGGVLLGSPAKRKHDLNINRFIIIMFAAQLVLLHNGSAIDRLIRMLSVSNPQNLLKAPPYGLAPFLGQAFPPALLPPVPMAAQQGEA